MLLKVTYHRQLMRQAGRDELARLNHYITQLMSHSLLKLLTSNI